MERCEGRPADDLAREGEGGMSAHGRPTTLSIQKAVAERFNLHVEDLRSSTTTRRVTVPRMIAMTLARELTGLSLPRIGRQFSRDHTTVMYAIMSIATRHNTPANCRHMDELRVQILHADDWRYTLKVEREACVAVGVFLRSFGDGSKDGGADGCK